MRRRFLFSSGRALGRAIGCASALALAAAACGDAAAPALTPASEAPTSTLASLGPTSTLAEDPTPWPADLSTDHQDWTVRVVGRIEHDPARFTQGLEMSDGGLLEGTGRRGESTLLRLDPTTGAVLDVRALEPSLFGEGLTVAGDEIIQLTWEAGRALRYDETTLEPVGEFTYDGVGWGICAGPADLWMSDGTPGLQRRDPETFELLDTVTVQRDGEPVDELNELECIGDHVVANTWKSDDVIVIEPTTGAVVATIDADVLAEEVGATDDQAVLNGIADLGDGTLLLGGKLWPTLFVVVVEPVD